MPLYVYADITLFSTFPMAGLLAAVSERKNQSPDLTFQIMESPPPGPATIDWIHHWYTTSGDISISLARIDKGFLLRFPSLADFVIDAAVYSIGAWAVPGTDEETVRHLLLDQILPRVLAYKGRLVLHASAVSVEGQAIAFVGETGWGKSTLAASLHLSGYPLLTDDGLLIKTEGDCVKALPSYSGLRLWSQSINALFKELPSCKAMASYSEKNRVRLPKNNKTDPIELTALFILGEPALEAETGSIKVSSLSQRDACMELVRNSFQLDVSNHKQVTGLFTAASSVAERLPVFTLSYPRDFSCLPAVHDVILQQYRELAPESD